jgi:hypothetical protein
MLGRSRAGCEGWIQDVNVERYIHQVAGQPSVNLFDDPRNPATVRSRYIVSPEEMD